MPGNFSFLVVPFGLHWGEVTASRLILVDGEGRVIKGPKGSMVEDTASLDLEHIRTIFTPVLKLTYYAFIFSDSWSTTMLLGAHTNIGVLICKLGQ